MQFKIIKHFSLDFLGDEWKDAYINFKPLSVGDIKDKLPQIAKLQEKDADFGAGADVLISLLTEKFIEGKGVDESGTLVAITKDDIQDLPIDVIGGAFAFLSESQMTPTSTPSAT